MATRFDASTEWLDRSASVPAIGENDALTCGWWFNMIVDQNDWQTLGVCLDNDISSPPSSATYVYVQPFQNGGDNTFTLYVATDSSEERIGSVEIDDTTGWIYFAWTKEGDNYTFYWGTPGNALSSASNPTIFSGFTSTHLRVADSVFGGEWSNGRTAAVKIWTDVLSLEAIEIERQSFMPTRTLDLWGVWPLMSVGDNDHLTDYSGNGRDFSQGAGGTPTTEDGPPIAWTIKPPDTWNFKKVVAEVQLRLFALLGVGR